jgi:hypothetical protein
VLDEIETARRVETGQAGESRPCGVNRTAIAGSIETAFVLLYSRRVSQGS